MLPTTQCILYIIVILVNTFPGDIIFYYKMNDMIPNEWSVESIGGSTIIQWISGQSYCPYSTDYCWEGNSPRNTSSWTLTRDTQSTIGYTNVQLTWFISMRSKYGNGDCYIEYMADNSTWIIIAHINQDTSGQSGVLTSWIGQSVNNNNSNVRIRLRSTADYYNGGTSCYYNELKLTGDPITNGNPSGYPDPSDYPQPTTYYTHNPTHNTKTSISFIQPTSNPTPEPTPNPTKIPTTNEPTEDPIPEPTPNPTKLPTIHALTYTPTYTPTDYPTEIPSADPTTTTTLPTNSPTNRSANHTVLSSSNPTIDPTVDPTIYPTIHPTIKKKKKKYSTAYPSVRPTVSPTINPTLNATKATSTIANSTSVSVTVTETKFELNEYIIIYSVVLFVFVVIISSLLSLICIKKKFAQNKTQILQTKLAKLEQMMHKNGYQLTKISMTEDTVAETYEDTQLIHDHSDEETNNIELTEIKSNNNNETSDDDELEEMYVNANRNHATDENEMNAVEKWLYSEVKLPEYYTVFTNSGFNSLEMIVEINKMEHLNYIGIPNKAHQIKLINHIQKLHNCKDNMNLNVGETGE